MINNNFNIRLFALIKKCEDNKDEWTNTDDLINIYSLLNECIDDKYYTSECGEAKKKIEKLEHEKPASLKSDDIVRILTDLKENINKNSLKFDNIVTFKNNVLNLFKYSENLNDGDPLTSEDKKLIIEGLGEFTDSESGAKAIIDSLDDNTYSVIRFKRHIKDLNQKLNLSNEYNFTSILIKPPYFESIANDVSLKIQKKGLYDYLDDSIKNIHIGDNKNIIRKILVGFNVIRGAGSYLCETIAKSGAGKSLEDEIAFLLAMPQEYIFRKNSMTVASFTRYNPRYFDRKIIYFGDFGSKKSFEHIEEVFNIIKVLISEGYYSRDVSERIKGKWESTSLDLRVDSVGGVYSSILNSFSGDDEQLESRSINFTPTETEDTEKEVLDFMFDCFCEDSPENILRQKSIRELEDFQQYLKMLINKDLKVINPYKRVFIEYALNSDVPKRELIQQLELFESYCILSYTECKEINGHLVASQKQFKNYFNNISLENALKPYESNFLNMILAKGKKNELVIMNDDVTKETPNLNYCINEVMEDFIGTQRTLDNGDLDLDDLDNRQEQIFIKKLINYYGLGSRSSKFTNKPIFFTYNSLKRLYKKYSDFKNVEDISKLLMILHKKGYLDKLDYKYNKQNIYYLTPKCESINTYFELTKEDLKEANKFITDKGIL